MSGKREQLGVGQPVELTLVRRNSQAPVTVEQDNAIGSRTPVRAGYSMIAYES
jgi:hypothetical protein